MALNLGELVAYLKMDKADWDRSKRAAKDDLDDIADEAEKSGKKTDKSTKDAAKKVERNFSAIQFGALFAGMPLAAAGAAAGTAGSLALVSGGFIALTAVALKSNTQVQESMAELSTHVEDSVQQMAEPLAGDFTDALDKVGEGFDRLQPQVAAAMRNSARDVGILADGVVGLAEEAMPGLVVATNRDTQALQGLSSFLTSTGRGMTDFFVSLSTGSAAAGQDMVILGQITQQLFGFLGQLLANLATNGTPTLSAFGGGLHTIEQILLAVTAAGSPAYAVLMGFISTANGGLAILQLLVSLLGLLPPGLSQFAGELLATSKILGAFGINAFAAFDGLGKKIKETDGFGNKFKTGVSGLVAGALNPATIAVGLLAFGLGVLGQAQQDAAARTAAHRSRVDELATALRQSNGAITGNTRATAAAALADYDAGDGKRNLLADVRNLAGSQGIPLLTDAYLGNRGALDQLKATLQANVDTHYHAASAAELLTTRFGDMRIGAGGTVEALDETGRANKQLLDIVNQEAGTFQQAAEKNRDLAAASGEAGSAAQKLTYEQKLTQQASGDLSKAFQGLAQTETDVATKGKLLQQVLDTLNGRAPSHEQAIQSINDTIRSLGEEFGKGANKADGWGKALLNADGTVNSTTKNGSALLSTMESLQSGFANTGASIDELVRSGVPLQQATQQVSAELTTQRQRFIDVATQMGLTRAQAEQLANKYGLIPAEVLTSITQPGMPQAQAAADILRGKVLAVPDSHTTITSALTADAIARLNDLGYRVRTLPDGRVVVYTDTGPAQAGVETFINRNSSRYITITTRVVNPDGSVRVGSSRMNAAGNLLAPFAGGGIAAMAGGGLTPMSSNVATMVPPDTWRVVGDNMRYQELYAPLNGSRRTADLITAAAKHEGLPVGEVMPVPVPQQRASVHIDNYYPPANASPHDIAEELDWLSRTGG
jgi:predicted  nucleic acid-binding Zn-ribbon protein